MDTSKPPLSTNAGTLFLHARTMNLNVPTFEQGMRNCVGPVCSFTRALQRFRTVRSCWYIVVVEEHRSTNMHVQREQKCGRDIRTTQKPYLVVLSRFLSGSGVLASTFVFENSHKKNKHGHIAGVLIA